MNTKDQSSHQDVQNDEILAFIKVLYFNRIKGLKYFCVFMAVFIAIGLFYVPIKSVTSVVQLTMVQNELLIDPAILKLKSEEFFSHDLAHQKKLDYSFEYLDSNKSILKIYSSLNLFSLHKEEDYIDFHSRLISSILDYQKEVAAVESTNSQKDNVDNSLSKINFIKHPHVVGGLSSLKLISGYLVASLIASFSLAVIFLFTVTFIQKYLGMLKKEF